MSKDDPRLELADRELSEAMAIFRSLVRTDTTNPPGRERAAVDLLAAIFEARGIEYAIHEPEPGRASVVARLGPDKRQPCILPPLVLLSHLDVVKADPKLWKHPPFSAMESEGHIWGRGTLDTKQLTAMELAAFLHLAGSGLMPDREIVFAATADEEAGSALGMASLARGPLAGVPGSLAISEGGGFPIKLGGKAFILCTAGEKGMCRIRLSSGQTPVPANVPSHHAMDYPKGNSKSETIRTLAEALRRFLAYEPRQNLGGLASRFLDRAGIPSDQVAEIVAGRNPNIDEGMRDLLRYILYDSVIVSLVRSTSSPASEAEAEVELRIDPSMTEAKARNLVASILGDSSVAWEIVSFEPGFESDPASPLPGILEASCRRYGLDAELLPILALGRTDGRYIGTAGASVFGFSPVLFGDSFPEVLKRVHGNDERIRMDSFFFGCKVLTRTIMELCTPLEK